MPEELPPQVTFSKYLVVRDQYGVEQVIELPEAASILVFDGTNLKWSSGNAGNEFPLGGVTALTNGSVINGVFVAGSNDKLFRFGSGATDGVTRLFSIKDKVPKLDSISNLLGDGKGLLRKSADGTLSWLGGGGDPGIGEGIYWAKADGTVVLVTTNDKLPGQSLSILPGGTIDFASPSGITASSGSGMTGLDDVRGYRLTTTTVNVQCPSLALGDGSGSQIQANGVDVTFDSTVTGDGGVDIAGGLTTSSFYYLYVIAKSDGTISCVASLNSSMPDLTLSVDFLYYAFASLFYVKADGNIREFFQRGKRFWTEETTWVDNWVTPAVYTSVPGTVALGTLVPAGLVKNVSGRIGGGSAETVLPRQLWLAATNTGLGAHYTGNYMENFNGFLGASLSFKDMPIVDSSSPVLYGKVSTAAPSVRTKISITGYRI